MTDALRMVKQYAPNGIERSARFRRIEAALAAAPARVLSDEDVERAARAFYAAMLKANIAQYGGDGVGLGFDELVAKGEATYSAIMAAMRAALSALSADETMEGGVR